MKQLAVGANFKRAAAGRNEREGFDPFTKFKDLGRQTDGLGRVISNHAVFDRDFSLHAALLSKKMVGSWTPSVKFGKTSPLEKKSAPRARCREIVKPSTTRRGAPSLTKI